MKPLAIDLYCGLGGWTAGLLAAGYDTIGFDIERHQCGEHRYPAQLVIQDVLTLHGSQFPDAALIVASPPCQEYSWMSMPWSRAKQVALALRGQAEFPSAYRGSRTVADLTRLFDACFRIQREASEAAGHRVPLVVENVRGAVPWVGRSRWNFGSYHLWGDVPALMPHTSGHGFKGVGPAGGAHGMTRWTNPAYGFKSAGMNRSDPMKRGQDFTRIAGFHAEGRKGEGSWFGPYGPDQGTRNFSSNSPRRKEASALIAKIPFALAYHIAVVWRPSLAIESV